MFEHRVDVVPTDGTAADNRDLSLLWCCRHVAGGSSTILGRETDQKSRMLEGPNLKNDDQLNRLLSKEQQLSVRNRVARFHKAELQLLQTLQTTD